MAIMRRKGLALALALATLGALAVAQAADGSHPRPRGATPMRFALVPAYDQCAAPNRTHGPSLAFPSCFPPAPASDFLTVGTPDADGAAANSAGFMRVDVHPGAPGPPSDTDVLIKLQVSDVRCKAGTSTCGNANASGGPDYTGELQGNATIRITDDFNAATAGGGTDPATLIDIPVPVNAVCSNTADTSIGASCAISSSTQPLIPDPCGCEGKRMVVEFTQIRVDDGGADGRVATGGNTRFLSEGLFVP